MLKLWRGEKDQANAGAKSIGAVPVPAGTNAKSFLLLSLILLIMSSIPLPKSRRGARPCCAPGRLLHDLLNLFHALQADRD